MRYEFRVDKTYTAAIAMDFDTDDEVEASDMAADWLAEHWGEVECELAMVEFVTDGGEALTVYG